MNIIARPKGVNGHALLKELLAAFWQRFGGRKTNGEGFDRTAKIESLIEMANTKVSFHKQQQLPVRRRKFDEGKATLHPFRRFGFCFACGSHATARHHIVQLQHGGINSKKNLVSLCDPCHADIHPWLRR